MLNNIDLDLKKGIELDVTEAFGEVWIEFWNKQGQVVNLTLRHKGAKELLKGLKELYECDDS